MQSGIVYCIDQLLKFTRNIKDNTGTLFVLEQFAELKKEAEKTEALSCILVALGANVDLDNTNHITLCLNWTYIFATCLTQLNAEVQLSVSQESSCQSLLTLLVTLGVSPNLLPVLHTKPQLLADVQNNQSLKHRRLIASVAILLRLSFSSQLGPGFLHRHLLDILSALFQLCHAPIQKTAETLENQSKEEDNGLSQAVDNGSLQSFCRLISSVEEVEDRMLSSEELISEMHAGRKAMQTFLTKLQRFLYQPLLVQTVLTLQNKKRKSCPVWLRNCCGEILTSVLMQPSSGLLHLLQGMLQDLPPSSETVPDIVNARVTAVGRLLSQTPARCSGAQEYFSLIAPQMIALLKTSDTKKELFSCRVACNFLANVHVNQASLANALFFKPLLDPLLQLWTSDLDSDSNEVLLSSDELEDCLNTIHKVFQCCGGDSASVLGEPLISPVSTLLLDLASACGTSHLRSVTLDLLHVLMSVLDERAALDWLANGLEHLPQRVLFRRTPTGGMEALRYHQDHIGDFMSTLESRTEILWTLVDRQPNLQPAFFNRLLQMVANPDAADQQNTSIVLLLMLEKMAETVEPERLLKDVNQTAQVLQTMLKHFLQTCVDKDNQADIVENSETPLLSFTILSLFLQHRKLTPTDWQSLQILLPTLEELTQCCHLSDSIRSSAQQLRVAIATRGVVLTKQSDTEKDKKEEKEDEESFACAWRLLVDPEVAFKCHGLVLLKRLIRRKDPEMLQHKQIILEALKHEHLEHEDSCVYQPCIQALVALAGIFPRDVLPVLTSTYTRCEVQEETRLKVAEALVQICRQSPGVFSREEQRALLVSFLRVCRGQSLVMKISALSCLGEICQTMHLQITPQLQEVLLCMVSFLSSESEVELKRASAMALTHFLRGLGKNIFQVLKEELRDVYRVLLSTKSKTDDERLILHLDLALEEIKESVQQSLQDSATLCKHIRILDPF